MFRWSCSHRIWDSCGEGSIKVTEGGRKDMSGSSSWAPSRSGPLAPRRSDWTRCIAVVWAPRLTGITGNVGSTGTTGASDGGRAAGLSARERSRTRRIVAIELKTDASEEASDAYPEAAAEPEAAPISAPDVYPEAQADDAAPAGRAPVEIAGRFPGRCLDVAADGAAPDMALDESPSRVPRGMPPRIS